MPEGSSEKTANVVVLQVELTPVDRSDRPLTAHDTAVGVSQRSAYLDFGFVEPALMAAARNAKNGGDIPKNLEGILSARSAMPLETAIQQHHQLQPALAGFRTETPVTP